MNIYKKLEWQACFLYQNVRIFFHFFLINYQFKKKIDLMKKKLNDQQSLKLNLDENKTYSIFIDHF